MKTILRGVLSAFLLGAALTGASAADLPSTTTAPVPPVFTDSFNPWAVRLAVTGVLPTNGGSLSTAGGGYVSNGFKATNSVIPELDIGYYFTKNIAAQLVCCLSPHNVFLDGGALNGVQASRALLFPPTLLLQYHFTDFGAIQPYAGVGVNYTHFFGTTPNSALLSSVSIKDSWGVAAQLGVDYVLDRNWALNLDAKWILIDPTVQATTVGGVALNGRANINPVLVSAGIVYRFGGTSAPVVARY
ncbi:MAG: OmpW family outer membrane protein [Beijerinckiaceae bacterium]|nr:OmpW family outer membrane protein [Beijerinckiaceae bacterium]